MIQSNDRNLHFGHVKRIIFRLWCSLRCTGGYAVQEKSDYDASVKRKQ